MTCATSAYARERVQYYIARANMCSSGDDDALMNLCRKKRYIDIQILIKKMMFYNTFLPKYLVSPKKSSTFAPDLRLRLVNFKNGKNHTEKCNAENQPLTKKVIK